MVTVGLILGSVGRLFYAGHALASGPVPHIDGWLGWREDFVRPAQLVGCPDTMAFLNPFRITET